MKADVLSYSPVLAQNVFIMQSAEVIGRVTLGNGVNIWSNAVIRGDIAEITINDNTNIQDNCVVHVSTDIPVHIGSSVTVGHGAILHSCTVENHCLIGMGAIVLDNARIREGSIVGAGSLVPPGKEYPPHSLILGSPAKAVRTIRTEEAEEIRTNALHYVELAESYRNTLQPS